MTNYSSATFALDINGQHDRDLTLTLDMWVRIAAPDFDDDDVIGRIVRITGTSVTVTDWRRHWDSEFVANQIPLTFEYDDIEWVKKARHSVAEHVAEAERIARKGNKSRTELLVAQNAHRRAGTGLVTPPEVSPALLDGDEDDLMSVGQIIRGTGTNFVRVREALDDGSLVEDKAARKGRQRFARRRDVIAWDRVRPKYWRKGGTAPTADTVSV